MYKIFVAGPMRSSELTVEENVRVACIEAHKLLSMGYAVYLPHAFHLVEQVCKKHHLPSLEEKYRSRMLANDFRWLEDCDAVYRLCGASDGADAECALAEMFSIPVFRDIYDLSKQFPIQPNSEIEDVNRNVANGN